MRLLVKIIIVMTLLCGVAFPQQRKSKEEIEAQIRQLEQSKRLRRMGYESENKQSYEPSHESEVTQPILYEEQNLTVEQSPNDITEGVTIQGKFTSGEWEEYRFKPSQSGIYIFKTVTGRNSRHYLDIIDSRGIGGIDVEIPGLLARKQSSNNTIIMRISAENEYIIRLKYSSGEKEYTVSVGPPETYNAGDKDFSVTLAKDNKTCIITKYVGPNNVGTLIIPAKIQGVPVSEIGEFAFSSEQHYNRRTDSYFSGTGYNSEIVNVIISDGIKVIGDGAFFSNQMFTVTLPMSITTIGTSVFDMCKNLEEITLPNNIKSYGAKVFHRTGLKTIAFPPNMKAIPVEFLSKTPIKSVTMPGSVVAIGDGAFAGCDSLSNVTFPTTLKEIGNNAFEGCVMLGEILIPVGVMNIGTGAFSGCGSLTSVIIPNTITTINERTFFKCMNLVSVSLPSTIKRIDGAAFAFCKKLNEINIPNTVSKIIWGGNYYRATSFYDSSHDSRPFGGIILPLAIQIRLRQLGYEFAFDS